VVPWQVHLQSVEHRHDGHHCLYWIELQQVVGDGTQVSNVSDGDPSTLLLFVVEAAQLE